MRLALIDALLAVALVASMAVAIVRTPRGVSALEAQTRMEGGDVGKRATPAPTARHENALRRSVFRLDGALPGELVATAPDVPPPPTQLPSYAVSVRAITGGPPWRAILVGLPGAPEMRVVRPGDRFGPIEVRGILREHVMLVSADSSWHVSLPARRP